jgi:hypothetical protein
MGMEKTERGYRLSSGREFSANGHLVSIARNDDGTFRIREGYDGMLLGATGDEYDEYDEPDLDPGERRSNWTADERRELADFMIAQWSAFKDALKG